MESAARAAPIVGGQVRVRPLAELLAIARPAAARAGVTRLAELTQLDAIGLPVVQALRPRSRSLSTATGRGASLRAATLSALLEAIETDAAETLAPAGRARPLRELGPAALATWHGAARDALAVRLDPAVPRHWLDGEALCGGACPVPFDLVSQDLTCPRLPDTLPTTVGLASGGSRDEALAAAIAELLEHDLEADWRRASPRERRGCEIDVERAGTDPAVADALAALTGIEPRGLMTMAAYSDDPQAARPAFAMLRELRDRLRARTGLVLPELSMGMSGDFEVGVEEGATLVRVGTTLFEGLSEE